MSRPTGFEPVKAMNATSGARPGGADLLADAGEEASTPPAGHRPCSASTRRLPMAGVCSAGLRHHGVARDERGGDHPGRDGQREVPRRDHRRHAAPGRSGGCARPAATARARGLAVESQDLAGIVLAEVDGLAHVGVGLGPTACPPRTPRQPPTGCDGHASTDPARRPAAPPSRAVTPDGAVETAPGASPLGQALLRHDGIGAVPTVRGVRGSRRGRAASRRLDTMRRSSVTRGRAVASSVARSSSASSTAHAST